MTEFFVNLGNFSGMSSFLLVLWKNEYFAFVTLRKSLLARKNWLILLNSLFTVAKSTGMSQFEKNRLVSSANIIESRIFKAFEKFNIK